MGRYFRIHVKTNIEKLQLQSYVIYKKFRDVIALYEDIESICPEGKDYFVSFLFSRYKNKRMLLSVLNVHAGKLSLRRSALLCCCSPVPRR